MQFKHGDRVTCKIDGTEITDARISIDPDGFPFICQNQKNGSIAKDLLGYKYSYYPGRDFSNHFVENLKLAEKTLENLEAGDILIGQTGLKTFVLGVYKGVVRLQSITDGITLNATVTVEELKRAGHTLYQKEPLIEELTMEEVCEELGRTIKIKK
jgi:hypothetical protein